MDNWPGSIIDLLSLCWTENNKNNELSTIDKDAKNTIDGEESKLIDISMLKNEQGNDIEQDGSSMLAPNNTKKNEAEENFANNITSIKTPLLEPCLDKCKRKRTKNKSGISHTYSLRSNAFEDFLYFSPSSDHVSDPDWKVSSQKYNKKMKRRKKRKSNNPERNCFSEPIIIPYSLRSRTRNSTFSEHVYPQNENYSQQNLEMTTIEKVDSVGEIAVQSSTYEGKPIFKPKKGEKRKSTIMRAPTKKPCWDVKQVKNSFPLNDSINKVEVKRGNRSTLMVKKMLFDVGSTLNQIEAALTDWNYGSRIPTTAEASDLFYKIQEINTKLKGEYDMIRESCSQMDIMESLLDFLKKSEDLTFAIQRRIKKLNKGNAANMIGVDRLIILLEKFKIEDDINDNSVRSNSIIRKPHLIINGLNENSNHLKFSKGIMQNKGLSTIQDSFSRNKSFTNDFRTMEEYKRSSEVLARSPIFKIRNESTFGINPTVYQQTIKITKEKELTNSEYAKIPKMFKDHISLSGQASINELKHKDTHYHMSTVNDNMMKKTKPTQNGKQSACLEMFPDSNCEETSKSTLREKSVMNIKKYRKSTVKIPVTTPTFQKDSTRSNDYFESKKEFRIINKPPEENNSLHCKDKMKNIDSTVHLEEQKSLAIVNKKPGLPSHYKKMNKPLKIFLDKNTKSTSVIMKKENVENSPKETKHVFGIQGTFQHLSFCNLIESAATDNIFQPESCVNRKILSPGKLLNPTQFLSTQNASNQALICKADLINSAFTNVSGNDYVTGFVIGNQNVSLKLITNEFSDRTNNGVCQILLLTNKDLKRGTDQNYGKSEIIEHCEIKQNMVSCPEQVTKDKSDPHSGECNSALNKPLTNSSGHIENNFSTDIQTSLSEITNTKKALKNQDKENFESGNERQNDSASTVKHSYVVKNKRGIQEIKQKSQRKHCSSKDIFIKTKFEDVNYSNFQNGSELDGEIQVGNNVLNEREVVISCNNKDKSADRNSETDFEPLNNKNNDTKFPSQIITIQSQGRTSSLGNASHSSDINKSCTEVKNRSFCETNNPGANIQSSEDLNSLDIAQLCNTEEFLRDSLDINFIDDILTEFGENQTSDNSENHMTHKELLQENVSRDSHTEANKQTRYNETFSENMNVDSMNSVRFQDDVFQEREKVIFSGNALNNARDMFKVPTIPTYKRNINSPPSKKHPETTNITVPKKALNENNQHIDMVTHDKRNTPEEKKAFSIENIKFVRQKSEGEFLLIDNFSDLFSPNIFKW